MKQEIAFRRKKFLCESKDSIELSVERISQVQTFIDEFDRFGVKFSEEVLKRATAEEMTEFMNSNLPELVEKYHEGKENFKPLWPGFPGQVKDLPESVLFELQSKIYSKSLSYDDPVFSFYCPELGYTKGRQTRVIKREDMLIDVMEVEEFMSIPSKHCSSGIALPLKTTKELNWFLDNYDSATLNLTDKIPFKETLVLVMDKVESYEPSDLTDILRYFLIKVGSDLDKTPEKGEKLASIPRSLRRRIVGMLESKILKKGLEDCVIDAKRHAGKWMLLIKNIHAVDYKSKFPEVPIFFKLFSEDRNLFKTWNSKIQFMYKTKSTLEISKEVSKRPGEFLRRFDSLLRRALKDGGTTATELIEILENLKGAKNKTILELLSYYGRRGESGSRVVKLKSGKSKIIPGLEPLNAHMIEEISAGLKDLLFSNVKEKAKNEPETLEGKFVVLDEAIKDVPVPVGLRGGEFDFPAGTSLDIPDEVDYIRFFVHWIQEPGKFEDLDMHGSFYSEDFSKHSHIGWNSSVSASIGVYSGDVRGKEGNCAEYVDVDIKGALKEGFRYVSMDVYNYEGRGLDSLPCWLGYEYRSSMAATRNTADDLEWSPTNPQFMMKSTCKSTNIAAWCFDLKEKKAYLINSPMGSFTAPSGLGIGEEIIRFVLEGTKLINSYDLLQAYYIAKGAIILDKVPEDDTFKEEDLEVITKDEILRYYSKVIEVIAD